jgi:CRISPR-associated protein Csb1
MLLLESAQSVANRLETSIWDEANQDVVAPLKGISYILVKQNGNVLTNSLLEAHRLSSFYILEGKDRTFAEKLTKELDIKDDNPVNFQNLAKVLARYDINSLLHGIFIAKKEIASGRFKLARALSGFIEARNIEVVSFGGVKNDRVNSSEDAKKGGGNVPYHKEEYTAEKITAYFNLDLNQIRGYRLGQQAEDLLITIALYKIQRFLEYGLRLRTACDLECTSIIVKRPDNFELPELKTIGLSLPEMVKAAHPLFADPAVTEVNYVSGGKKE